MSVPESNLFIDPSAARDSSPASVMSHKESVRQLAPIALFVYNRPKHTRRTVESLQANILARRTDLFVFSDAAKKESAAAVEAVRKFIRTIDGFNSVTIIERERNCGLANSIIGGVSHVCNEFGRVVAIEDDLLTTADFLTFMNHPLMPFVPTAAVPWDGAHGRVVGKKQIGAFPTTTVSPPIEISRSFSTAAEKISRTCLPHKWRVE